ncbi:hypothetical protein AALB16_13860 [Lachnospiraceae bacterium 62-35]
MPVSNNEKAIRDWKRDEDEKRYPVTKLLKSRRLSEYQPDFAKVILTEKEYTISEAKEALDKILKGGK